MSPLKFGFYFLLRLWNSYSDQIKEGEMGRTCSMNERYEKCIQNFGWKSRRDGNIGRHRQRWEDNITMDQNTE